MFGVAGKSCLVRLSKIEPSREHAILRLMGRRKKQQKFQELATFPHVLQPPEEVAGRWNKYFDSARPLVVELGCGYGEYTIALAKRYPEKNYVGVDIQGERLWRGSKISAALSLRNVMWLRAHIEQLDQYFGHSEVDEIWLTFPDPFPKRRHVKKRLTAPPFLALYRGVLKPKGRIHLKTDVDDLFQYTQQTVAESGGIIDRVLSSVAADEQRFDLDIITRYEKKHRDLGSRIHYLSWHW